MKLRCFLGSLLATVFWPAVIALTLYLVVSFLGTLPSPGRVFGPGAAYWGPRILGGGIVLLAVLIFGIGFVAVSETYYEKCHAYWTLSEDPTWREAIRKMFSSPPDPPFDPVQNLVVAYETLDEEERGRFLTLIRGGMAS